MAQFLAPIINEQQFDANGDPLVGGTIEVYLAGTSTPAATTSDQAGATPNTWPIELNTLGLNNQGAVWITGGASYKYVIKDANGVTIRTIDNIDGINDTAVALSQWVVFQGTPTYASATSFSVPGDQTQILQTGRRIKTTNTGGTIYSTISSSVYSAPNTTVIVYNDSGTLDAGLSAVSYGLISVNETSLPGIFIFGQCRLVKSGADLALLPAVGGNRLTINGVTQRVPNAGVTLAATGLVVSTLYYIYAYMNGGVMTLEASTTTHATDASTGMEVKAGDVSRTLVGMARPVTGPAWIDTSNQRFVASWFNRVAVNTYAGFTANRTTANTALSEVNTEIRNEFLTWGSASPSFWIDGYCTNNTLAGVSQTAIAIDGIQAPGFCASQAYAANAIMPVSCSFANVLSEGYHYATLFSATTAATQTLYVGIVGSFSVASLKGVVYI